MCCDLVLVCVSLGWSGEVGSEDEVTGHCAGVGQLRLRRREATSIWLLRVAPTTE